MLQRPSLRRLCRNGRARRAKVRGTRRREAVGRHPAGRQPQGCDRRAARSEAAARKQPGEVVLGWMAAHLLTEGDRDADNPLYNVDHLLELWDAVHLRVPHARLWLVGGPSARLIARLAGRDDVVLFGRLPRERALAVASQFDVAPYARTQDQGIRAAKVSEFIGLRRADCLLRLRGDLEPPRDGRRDPRAGCPRVRRRGRSIARPT